MIELRPSQFTAAAPLFAEINHDVPIVFSVLEGTAVGRVFVDRVDRPRCALLDVRDAFSYIAGDEKNDAFARAVMSYLFDGARPSQERHSCVLVAFTDAWRARLDELLAFKGATRLVRKAFSFDAATAPDFHLWRGRVPEGHRMELTALTEGDARFVLRLTCGEEVVSECGAVVIGRGEAEADVHTAEDHQRRGLGTITASAFLEECCRRGLKPSWSCWSDREASIALAKKLGFVEREDVPAHYWDPLESPRS